MAIFDHVVNVPEQRCPKCNLILWDWQTKDDYPCLRTVDFTTVREFYTICDSCRIAVTYRRKPATSIEDFDLVIE